MTAVFHPAFVDSLPDDVRQNAARTRANASGNGALPPSSAALAPSGLSPCGSQAEPPAANATCDTCQHLGAIYWDDGFSKTHRCRKSTERRRDDFKSSGDFADDFMNEFRKFYDARSGQRQCGYYAERVPLSGARLDMLRLVDEAGREGFVAKFFSDENRVCGEMRDMFVDGGSLAFPQEPARGERRWFITKVGKAELARASTPKDFGDEA